VSDHRTVEVVDMIFWGQPDDENADATALIINFMDTLTGPRHYLVLTDRKSGSMLILAEGRNIRIKAAHHVTRGRLDAIVPDSLIINGQAFAVNDIDAIWIQVPGYLRAGSVATVGGSLMIPFGALIAYGMFSWIATAEGWELLLAVIFGGIAGVIGVAGAVLGVGILVTGITMLAMGKKFELHKHWKAGVEYRWNVLIPAGASNRRSPLRME